jgi:hypothetical protein
MSLAMRGSAARPSPAAEPRRKVRLQLRAPLLLEGIVMSVLIVARELNSTFEATETAT